MKELLQLLTTPTKLKVLLSLILIASLSRISIPSIIGHLPNFSAVSATALFCGAYFARKFTAFFVILLSVWLGDIALNKLYMGQWTLFYPGFYWQYGSYLLITLIGVKLKNKVNIESLLLASISSALLFFLISNFGVWYSGTLYPLTCDGLVACYVAALPFFKNTLVSNLFFSLLLLGSFEWLQYKFLNPIKVNLAMNE